ncbi:MAG TPA: NAD+ synthase [Candidatus Megaira endosymbiont of Nemacystus decipiens]|nr:NAD+ synthase [Candidatus Megaera endosymbiont of Nemacystus decipiens]
MAIKIYLCQTVPKTADLEHNYNNIKTLYRKAQQNKADICLLPEMALCGYMLGDLICYDDFINDIKNYNNKLISLTQDTHLILSTITKNREGRLLNSVIVARKGKIIAKTAKVNLPNYGIFDEKRYFVPGTPKVIKIKGINVGIPICEDIWFPNVISDLKSQGAELLLVPNASPFDKTKFNERCNIIKKRYEESSLPIIYCNQVMSQDGIIFDGRSLCFDGSLKIVGKRFTPDQQMITFQEGKFHVTVSYPYVRSEEDDIIQAMIMGTRDYVLCNGFKKVVIGISGGIDSALVAYIAKEALGASNVLGYMLPSIYTSDESKRDAKKLAQNLGISLKDINISDVCNSFMHAINLSCEKEISENSIAYQNLQSRVRGSILMSKSNSQNALLLTTGNKSEYAVGYATIYGDMNGAFNPIKDLYKTEVFNIARHINKNKIIIPEEIIDKEPSAELCFNQKDTDSLPEYKVLDKILCDHIENKLSQRQLAERYDRGLVKKILSLVQKSEFKRHQSAPGVKISKMSFDKDRRVPITHF